MLQIENLNLKLNDKKTLTNITFSAKRGTLTVITGENGSGKTSLLKSIMGINSASGKIMLDNLDFSSKDASFRAKNGFSYAFQHPALFKGITVKKLLEIANNNAKQLDWACNYLSQVGLCARDYLDREFNKTLSGGERKRIELALCLARDAEVYLFDEPESGIDLWSHENLSQIFENLKKQNKIVIIVSHNKKILEKADNVLVLKDGKLLEESNAQAFLRQLDTRYCIKLKGGK